MIIRDKRPVLIEAMSYRGGDHSTSDYSKLYRDEEEMKKWKDLLSKFSDPIKRLENYLLGQNAISSDWTQQLRDNAKDMVRTALKEADSLPKPDIDTLFTEVYDKMPGNLKEQREYLKEHLKKYPDQYNLGNFLNGKEWPHQK